jgi:hypothetical protein
MATGLAMPVGVNESGGARLSEGDENDDKIIRLALGDDASENAFQQNIGVGADMVFGQSDELLQAQIMRRVNEVFKRFEAQKRYMLRRNTIAWSIDSNTQELILQFKYVALESDREQTFRESFSAAASNT